MKDLYKDTRWQKKRLEIMQRDGWKCVACEEERSTLHVHHKRYAGKPWDVSDDDLQTLCEKCHTNLGDHPKAGVWWVPRHDGLPASVFIAWCPNCEGKRFKDKGSYFKCLSCGWRSDCYCDFGQTLADGLCDQGNMLVKQPECRLNLAASLKAWDRVVIEALVSVPESAGLIVTEVRSDDIYSEAGRQVLHAARRLHYAGRPVGLSGLLMEIPDPGIQSLLVAVDHAAADSGPRNAEDCIYYLRDAMRRRSAERQADEIALKLKTAKLSVTEVADLFEQLVKQRRASQAPAKRSGL